MCFCFTFACFSQAPVGLFSRSRLRGTQGFRLYTTVAGPPGVESREIWKVIAGSLSAETEPSKTTENPHVSCFLVMPIGSTPAKGSNTVATIA